MRFTMALPTITPSAIFDTGAASSGVVTSNPTATEDPETFLSTELRSCNPRQRDVIDKHVRFFHHKFSTTCCGENSGSDLLLCITAPACFRYHSSHRRYPHSCPSHRIPTECPSCSNARAITPRLVLPSPRPGSLSRSGRE